MQPRLVLRLLLLGVSDLERAHGRISAADKRQAITRGLEEVVLPAARLLLGPPRQPVTQVDARRSA